jgi:hypothetical protein
MTFSITTLSLMTIQRNNNLNATLSIMAEYCYVECHYAECHYAECRYAEWHGARQFVHIDLNTSGLNLKTFHSRLKIP